jgi:tetratricopeptide (TPR) repeat protein
MGEPLDAVDAAVRLGAAGDLAGAVAALDAVVARWSGDDAPESRAATAAALYNKGLALHATGDHAGALAALDAVVGRYGADEHAWVRAEVAGALANRARLLATAGRLDEALASFDDALARHEDDDAAAFHLFADRLAVVTDQRPEAVPDAVARIVRRFPAAAPDVEEAVDDLLTRCGTTLAGQGRVTEAVAAFDGVRHLWGERDDATSRYRVALALYNGGVALRESRADDALTRFDDALGLVRDGDEPPLHAVAARLRFNSGVLRYEIDRPAEAIEVLEPLVRGRTATAAEEAEDVAGWVARSMYTIGRAQLRLRRLDEALTTWDALCERFTGAGRALTDQVVEVVDHERRWVRGMRERPGHVYRNEFERSTAALYETWLRTGKDPETGADVEPELAGEYLELHRRNLDVADALSASLHDAAVAVLYDAQDRGTPFALFLRGFELEAYLGRGTDRLLMLGGQGPTAAETGLMRALAPRIPLVGISNPRHLLNPSIGFEAEMMPRLETAGELWEARVGELVGLAAVVFAAASRLTPGLETELGLIRGRGREGATVVVLEDPEDALGEYVGRWFGVRRRPRPALEPGGAALAPFPLVIAAADLPWDALGEARTAEDVLAAVAAAAVRR